MNSKISIIVPVYNAQKYLKRCIDSILNQTYENIQLILVNDGSTDGSLDICKESCVDSRVSVIDKKNEGVSSARNCGIDLACGEYIAFVDADDALNKDYINKLYKKCTQYDADIAICGYIKNGKECLVNRKKSDEILDFKELGRCIISDKSIGVMPWGKLFKREIIGSIRFLQGRIYEDDLFCFQVYSNCHKVVKINEPLYYYSENENGITYGGFSIKDIDILPISHLRLKTIENSWPDQLCGAIYVAACSFIDIHIEYAKRNLKSDNDFRIKLFNDREDLYNFFVSHESLISKKINKKIKYYYLNPGKVMIRDTIRFFRYALIKRIKNTRLFQYVRL